ncbi:MAG: polymer-forming cytoskeletal protein [Pseudomonadota bacterium]
MKKKEREKVIAFLGKDTDFKGRLTFYGTIRIDGHFSGKILAIGILIVGEGARIEADLRVNRIVIQGEVHGNIIAEEKIEILSPGRVFGDVFSPKVLIEHGALFNGHCWMDKKVETFEREWGLASPEAYMVTLPPGPDPLSGTIKDGMDEDLSEMGKEQGIYSLYRTKETD